jgi:hypothetical protein
MVLILASVPTFFPSQQGHIAPRAPPRDTPVPTDPVPPTVPPPTTVPTTTVSLTADHPEMIQLTTLLLPSLL